MTTIKQHKISLPYFKDSAMLFSSLADKEWSIFLDSGFPYSQQGRYDIISADPVVTLVTTGAQTTITQHAGCRVSDEDPFILLKQHLCLGVQSINGLPFNGGAMGYFSYDLARRIENLPALAKDEEHIAEMAVGIYEWAVIVDHSKKETYLVANDGINRHALAAQFSILPNDKTTQNFVVLDKPHSNMDKQRYQQAFNQVKHYLKEGDSYQVNLAQRFVSACQGNPWVAYKTLRETNAAPFSAYLNFPHVRILSSSPERFLKVSNNIFFRKFKQMNFIS